MLQVAGSEASVAVADRFGHEGDPLDFKLEADLGDAFLLSRGLARFLAQRAGIGAGEGKQFGERWNHVGRQALLGGDTCRPAA